MRPSGLGGAVVKDAVFGLPLSRLVPPKQPGTRQTGPPSRALRLISWLVVSLLAAAPIFAQVIEFPLGANRVPNYVTVGPDGALWFTDFDRIGRITTNGVVTEHAI